MITTLKPNEVFIFGSNASGFHGAGSAGLACRGTPHNTWRDDEWFLKAMKSPMGSPNRVGKWAVYGRARGFQTGREGSSYAIQTIEHPGMKRSTPLTEIQLQLLELAIFARARPELTFLMTPVGAGLAGWTDEEMESIWSKVVDKMPINVIYPRDLYHYIDFLQT